MKKSTKCKKCKKKTDFGILCVKCYDQEWDKGYQEIEIEKTAEMYFIKFLFCKNRDLLRREYRELYDALFDRYLNVYKLSKKQKMDLMDINKRFENEIIGKNK